MMNVLHRLFRRANLQETPTPPSDLRQRPYTLYNYQNPDGTFDYERYRSIQISGNKRKLQNVWALEENIRFLSQKISQLLGPVSFGLCHGTRRGKEQQWFRKYLGCEVIGTEISDTASSFPHTIQWDFHEAKAEWINAVDFIYSNSFDHTYDPKKCLNTWMTCVKKPGLCILEHSSRHAPEATNELDPFGADLTVMPYLVTAWSDGLYGVSHVLPAPATLPEVSSLHFIFIQRF